MPDKNNIETEAALIIYTAYLNPLLFFIKLLFMLKTNTNICICLFLSPFNNVSLKDSIGNSNSTIFSKFTKNS